MLLRSGAKFLFQRNISLFSRKKGLQQKIKVKEINKIIEENTQSQDIDLSKFQKMVVNMKMLMAQFYPLTLLALPILLTFQQSFESQFLLGELLAEKYASVALLMNLNFEGNKAKMTAIFTIMALLHTLTGYYSILTPAGMSLLTFFIPFKFSNFKQKYSVSEAQRLKRMSNIRVIYFFLFILIGICKAIHYEAVFSMEKKLDQFNKESLKITTQSL